MTSLVIDLAIASTSEGSQVNSIVLPILVSKTPTKPRDSSALVVALPA